MDFKSIVNEIKDLKPITKELMNEIAKLTKEEQEEVLKIILDIIQNKKSIL